MELDAVADGGHGMLAHAEVQVLALGGLGGEVALALHVALVGGGQVGGAAEQVRDALGQAVQRHAAGIAGGGLALEVEQRFVLGQVHGQLVREPHVPFLAQLGELLGIRLEQLLPVGLGLLALLAGLVGDLIDLLGHAEGFLAGPVQVLLGDGDVLLAEGLAVGGAGALLGGAVADGGVGDHQGGLVGLLRQLQRGLDLLVAVALLHVDHVPAVGAEAGGHVLAEGDVGVALDGDLVVIVDGDQLVQLQRARQRAALVADALHHAAVAQDAVGVVVHHREALAVELRRQVLFGHGHAHRVGDALAQGAGGGLDAAGVAVLGMAGGQGAELAELLEVVDLQAVAEQVQQAIQQHGAVTGGQHKAIPVGPLGVGGIVLHLLAPDGVGGGRRAHGHAGVTGLGLLNALGGQDADRVDDHALFAHWKCTPI